MKFAACEIPLFRRHVLAVMGCTQEEGISFFRDYLEENGEGGFSELEIVPNADGWCQQDCGDVYIWAESESCAVLIHEIVHAAFHLCRLTDVSEDEELICRLVEHMKLQLVDQMEDMR